MAAACVAYGCSLRLQATGVERAFLCGMLALPEASLPELPSRAFAGFVLVVQEPLDTPP